MQSAVEKCTCFLPVALYGNDRNLQRVCNFLERQSAEVPHLHDIVCAPINGRKLAQRTVEQLHVRGRAQFLYVLSPQRDLEPMIALVSVALASVVDHNAAHDLRGVCEKHSPVCAGEALLLHETQIGLVHETAGVERAEPLLPSQLPPRQSTERYGVRAPAAAP